MSNSGIALAVRKSSAKISSVAYPQPKEEPQFWRIIWMDWTVSYWSTREWSAIQISKLTKVRDVSVGCNALDFMRPKVCNHS